VAQAVGADWLVAVHGRRVVEVVAVRHLRMVVMVVVVNVVKLKRERSQNWLEREIEKVMRGVSIVLCRNNYICTYLSLFSRDVKFRRINCLETFLHMQMWKWSFKLTMKNEDTKQWVGIWRY
jgi:hypothetical protein